MQCDEQQLVSCDGFVRDVKLAPSPAVVDFFAAAEQAMNSVAAHREKRDLVALLPRAAMASGKRAVVGFSRDEIDIELNNGVLSIKGAKRSERTVGEEGERVNA